MKRFVLFSGDDYYPCGGWEDRAGTFDTLEEAQQSYAPREWGWAQVVDLEEDAIVSGQHGRLGDWKRFEA